MSIDDALLKRAESKCELCSATENLGAYDVSPITIASLDKSILVCSTCLDQIDNPDNIDDLDANHWRCLNDSMWSATPAVQVMAWRMLNRLNGEGWPNDLLEMLYIEDHVKKWAMEDKTIRNVDEPTTDCNGAELFAGDSVTLTKDLYIKGANFTAKRGTLIKGISLTDNSFQIEGNISGTRTVLAGKYLKKA